MPARNPYHFGSQAEGAYFCDRERELRTLVGLMLNGQNAILIAPRRFGKSSLLTRAIEEVRARGGRTGRANLMRCSTEREVAEELMRAVVQGPAGWLRGNLNQLAQTLKRIRVEPQLVLEEGELKGVKLGGSVADVNWRDVIADVVRLLGELGDDEHPVSLVVDEFQRGYEISEAIPSMVKALIDELPRVSLVLAGSKRHLMDRISADPEDSPLYNVGLKLYLEAVPREEMTRYLCERATGSGKSLSAALADRIYTAVNGIPNDVQLVAFFAWEQAARSIDEAAVDAALRLAVEAQKDEFERIFDSLATSQRLLLKLIAVEGGVEELSGSRVLRALDVSHTAARKAAEVLQRQDLIVRLEGRWVIFSGLFRQWLTAGYE